MASLRRNKRSANDPEVAQTMSSFQEEQAKRLYGLGDLEGELLEVMRLIVRQTERGENLDARSFRASEGRCRAL
jgi:hypothetical protein